ENGTAGLQSSISQHHLWSGLEWCSLALQFQKRLVLGSPTSIGGGPHLAEAAVLTGLMFIPVIGALLMLATIVLGLRSVVIDCYRVWPRMKPLAAPNPHRASS